MAENNLEIVVRERGKIVTRRDGHNIWVNQGRSFLSQVMAYQGYDPDTFQQANLPRFMGFGLGGTKQNAFGIAAVAPCLTHYPGTNNNLNIDPDIDRLERPVRIDWTVDPPSPPTGSPPSLVYDPGDLWLQEVTPVIHPTAYTLQWSCTFSETDFSRSTFIAVPLSEIGLFLNGSDPNVYNNTLIAYDTFETITKTENFSIDVTWTVRF
jgi:hypothetical protein